MEDNRINMDSNYVQVSANNKFEWNTYMIVLSRNGYKFEKGSSTEFVDSCYIAYSEKDKLVYVSDNLDFAVSVWELMSMKQFLYKFNMLDKAMENEKFSKYHLEEKSSILNESQAKILESLTTALEINEDVEIDSNKSLYESGYISRDEYYENDNNTFIIQNFKNALRGAVR